MTAILKLGGSLLTDKRERETVDRESLESVADRLATADSDDLVLVHGGGSFGHPAAAEHGVSRTNGTRDPTAIREVGAAMGRLNDTVVGALVDAGVAPVGLSPRPLAYKSADGTVSVAAGAVRALLAEDHLPVLYGDLVAHIGVGCSVLDGDRLAVGLADALGADRVGLCADVPGVLDADGDIVPRIARYDAVADVLDAPDGADVTGGIGGKIDALLESRTPGSIFGIEALEIFLAGELPGTRVGDFEA